MRGDHCSETPPPALGGVTSSSSHILFVLNISAEKNNLLEYRGLRAGFWEMIPESPLTNNHKGLSPLSFAIHYFKMHFKNAVGVLCLLPTEGAFTGSHCWKGPLPFKSWTEHLGVKTLPLLNYFINNCE